MILENVFESRKKIKLDNLSSDFHPISVQEDKSLVFSYKDLLVAKPKISQFDDVVVYNGFLTSGYGLCINGLLTLSLNKYESLGLLDYSDVIGDKILPKNIYPQNISGEDLFNAVFLFNDTMYGVENILAIWKANTHLKKGVGTNISQFNNYVQQGYTLLEAAANTFTGGMADSHGFHPEEILVKDMNFFKTSYDRVEVLFSR